MKLLKLAALLVVIQSALAQQPNLSFTGVVVDAASNRPLPRATLELRRPGAAITEGYPALSNENGQFVFSLDVEPTAEGPLNEETMQRVFQTSTNIIAKVLSNYRFESFDSVRLIHPLTGRNIVLPKARLELFR